MRLLLDEHFSPEIARQLRGRGHAVEAARERPALHGRSDRDLLLLASAEERAIVTENVADFAELHRQFVIGGDHHAGIVFTSSRRFPRTKRSIGRLVSALDVLLRERPANDSLADQVWWL
jgi:Domain of unknown function (DUF5615)